MDRENPAGSGSSYGHRTGEEGSQPRFVNKDEISGPVGANLSEFKTLEHKMLFSLAIELASFFFFLTYLKFISPVNSPFPPKPQFSIHSWLLDVIIKDIIFKFINMSSEKDKKSTYEGSY